ncbi:hypothetical protein BH10PSE16_BH10PSE16_05290 [soil metagenome]
MNKAFTKETDSEDDDDVPVSGLPLSGGNYITPQGYNRLRLELLDLIDSERPKVVDIVHWAASNGDRSENGDYLYGKKRLREIDRRIRFLTRRLEIAEISDPCIHNHRVIVPMSGKKLKSSIAGIRCMDVASGANTASSVPTAR